MGGLLFLIKECLQYIYSFILVNNIVQSVYAIIHDNRMLTDSIPHRVIKIAHMDHNTSNKDGF